MTSIRKYQNERPVDTDLFSGQGHRQVALAIANVLVADSTQHIIGIEGNLGAGKSTVINILEQEIVNNGFHVVTFDADQYHSTLKSALIKTIESELEPILKGKDHKYHRIRLKTAVETALGKRLKYTKDTTSDIPIPTIFFGFSLAVAALQIKPSLKFLAELTQDVPNLDILGGWLSIGLLGLPALVFGLMKLLGATTPLGDLVKRNSNDTITETINVSREVGAIELKEAFETFSSLIPKGRTLLLVVDNIDRVSPEIAREVWSDIEILTSLGSDRFRILLPYSEEHLAKALENSAIDETQSGKEFISKRIPVPFSAPPIVATGWRAQFEEYWSQTLPDIDGQEGVKDLIEIWAEKITPRYLKSIVNRIGAKIDSCPEAKGEISGVSCAAYLMGVRDNHLSIHQLLSEVIPADKEPDTERKLKATHRALNKYAGLKDIWSKQIAALHFQTSFTIAQSELLGEPIGKAIRTNDGKSLVDLSSLVGFDTLFRQQLTSIGASELVKLADHISIEEGGRAVVDKFLADINYEIKHAPSTQYIFDEKLIESYLGLIELNIDIDITTAEQQQKQVTESITNIWKGLKSCETSEDLSANQYTFGELENAVIECYQYWRVSGKTPPMVRQPSAEFIVNALHPIEIDVKDWDVSTLIEKAKTDKLVAAACKRHTLLENVNYDIFQCILDKMRIGDLYKLTNQELLIDINIGTEEFDRLLNLLPFTNHWHQSANKACYQPLVHRFESHVTKQDLESSELGACAALCAAAFVNELEPNSMVAVQVQNGRNNRKQAAIWLASTLQQHSGFAEHLTNYLSRCSFAKVLTWCKDKHVGAYLLPHLEELIKTGRVYRQNIDDLVEGNYAFLKQNLDGISDSDLIKWMEGWSRNLTTAAEEWDEEFVNDVFTCEAEKFLSILIAEFDDETITEKDWIHRLSSEQLTIKLTAQHLEEKGTKLGHQKPLQEALKHIPDHSFEFEIDEISTFLNLIDSSQRNGIRISMSAAFFKPETSVEKRNRIIRYFGSLLKMPKIKSETVEVEAITLLEHAIDNEINEVRNWLLDQPLDSWNISTWSKDNLSGLRDVLISTPETQDDKLTESIEARLTELQEA
ncbi:hypothetical protein CKF94_25275 [Vibrio coralliilyticus]|uniref:P-loop NTPase fold protein n=1 Tax=Vibrio coralliilyticus TaxID=190893 RepID=UPI000BAB0177|nr:P-loop NTPase fold protein [Vibrio coralliilyticus]PAU35435.1 hypothetical protein CKF94_25275 [Vibrio coralliilyticus]